MSDGRARLSVRAGISSDGPNGRVLPERLLEWLQEAAAHGSDVAGYPPERYEGMGAGWIISETRFVIDRPIAYRDALVVETWVSDLRRFRSHRQYRVTRGDEVVARAEIDWMLLERDAATGKVRPLRPDAEMVAAFPRHDERVLAKDELPEIGPAPASEPELTDDERVVRPTEIDRNGHVNNVHYLGWLEDHARRALGDASELAAVHLEYLQEASLGDRVTVRGWSLGRGLVRQDVVRDGKPVLSAVSRRVEISR
ncbi:thioesterase [Myxococcota bacterium]|nr:thioesterase [Myxococcota bacterium]